MNEWKVIHRRQGCRCKSTTGPTGMYVMRRQAKRMFFSRKSTISEQISSLQAHSTHLVFDQASSPTQSYIIFLFFAGGFLSSAVWMDSNGIFLRFNVFSSDTFLDFFLPSGALNPMPLAILAARAVTGQGSTMSEAAKTPSSTAA
jgi:hypothetical protein